MPKITLECDWCKAKFSAYPSEVKYGRRFCGTECFYQWLEKFERAKYVDVECLNCGKPIHILQSKYDTGRGRYCSRSCLAIQREAQRPRKPKVKRICRTCGTEFWAWPAWVRRGEAKYCSHTCAAQDRIRQGAYESPTSIEIALMTELEDRGVNYEFQYPMGCYVLDFAFIDSKLAVEADGVYWHSLPGAVRRDKRKDEFLADAGWTILHFDGDEIRASASNCIDKVMAYIADTNGGKHGQRSPKL